MQTISQPDDATGAVFRLPTDLRALAAAIGAAGLTRADYLDLAVAQIATAREAARDGDIRAADALLVDAIGYVRRAGSAGR